MYNFEGNYRRLPLQSLGGSSIETDRQTLIKKAQLERKKREEIRKKEVAVLRIQSLLRSYHQRQRVKTEARSNYENYFKLHGLNNFQDLEYLLSRLLYFYDITKDSDNLVILSQFVIKNINKLFAIILVNPAATINNSQWRFRVQKLLALCQRQIVFSSSTSIAIPMRMIEIFTSFDSIRQNSPNSVNEEDIMQLTKSIFSYMIGQNYYRNVRTMLDDKINENTYDEVTTKPRTEISKVILEMIWRPLKLVNELSADGDFDAKILASFSKEILVRDPNLTIVNFVIPSLALEGKFPLAKLLNFLYDVHMSGREAYNNNSGERLGKSIKFNGFLLNAILKLDVNYLDDIIRKQCLHQYLIVVGSMIGCIAKLPKRKENVRFSYVDDGEEIVEETDDESEDEDENQDDEMQSQLERIVLNDIIRHLNDANRVNKIVRNLDGILHLPEVVQGVCNIAHNLLIYNRAAMHDYRLLDLLAFKPEFIRTLWYMLLTTESESHQLYIKVLSKGIIIPPNESSKIIPVLATFCALFSRLLTTLHDGEFFYCVFDNDRQSTIAIESATSVEKIENRIMPFHVKDIVHMCLTLKELALGLVELAFPETRSAIRNHYRNILRGNEDNSSYGMCQEKIVWAQLLKASVSLLRQLYTRDLRLEFCPQENWIAPTANIPLDRSTDLHFAKRRGGPRPFQEPIRDFTRKDALEEGQPPLSTKQLRSITILKEIPFVVPFNKRFEVLQGLLTAEKIRNQDDGSGGFMQGFPTGAQITVTVRRTHLYEDAFEKLSLDNEPNLRLRLRVQMINQQGLEEAGIDGGGIFREFLSELIKTAFDPNRGFFILTKDNMLYPNPNASLLQENFKQHYYFIGRMLGKALFENLLVELPLAEFFLSKLAGRQSDTLEIHHLTSLDPDLYKNLMKLKNYNDNDFKDLGLDFTVVCDGFGDTQVVELKADGANIAVKTSNWQQYVQLMADFKLNRQISEQCAAFRQGLSNVLPLPWLYMFSTKDLSRLISGAEIPVDVDDLMFHTRYGGDYHIEHKTIRMFWEVVRGFTDLQKRQLLKFVTSCSRPPLLGFKNLDPPFCIQNAGDDVDRLASASTCMNLLKLPSYANEKTMREKLLLSITSGCGFELS